MSTLLLGMAEEKSYCRHEGEHGQGRLEEPGLTRQVDCTEPIEKRKGEKKT